MALATTNSAVLLRPVGTVLTVAAIAHRRLPVTTTAAARAKVTATAAGWDLAREYRGLTPPQRAVLVPPTRGACSEQLER
ncbi:hypothetical protein HK405_010487, partial [Cladochytrium tenue]